MAKESKKTSKKDDQPTAESAPADDKQPVEDAPAPQDADTKAEPDEKATEKKAEEKAEEKTPEKKPEKAAKRSVPAPPLPDGVHYIWGTGRRKKAVARVRIRPGSGNILINKRQLDNYFTQDKDRQVVVQPLETVDMFKSWDIWANVGGGGFTGQAGAVMLGLARALVKAVPDVEHSLRDSGLMTRDARMKERKKPGQKGARKKFQFSKR